MHNKTIITRLRENPGRYLLWGLFWSLLCAPVPLAFLFMRDTYAEKKREELRRIAAESPVHPDFVPVRSDDSGKSTGAHVVVTYRVRPGGSDYEGVKDFYTRELTARGWGTPSDERRSIWGGPARRVLTFRRGEHSVSITHEEGASEYNVFHGWERRPP